MGFGCDRTGLQTRICSKTSFSRYQRNKGTFASRKTYKTRNRFSFGKKCCRNCSKSSMSNRFLQHVIFSSKEKWRNETCDKSKTSEQLSQEAAFQNGHHEKSDKPSGKRRLEFQSRSKRCLLPHKDIQKAQKISSVSVSQCNISISSPVLRANFGSKSLYKSSGSSAGSFKKTEHTASRVSRRLVRAEPNTQESFTRQSVQSKSPLSTRIHDKQRQIKSRTYSKSTLHRRSIQSQTRPGLSLFRENTGIKNQSVSNASRSDNSQRLSDFVGHDCILSRSDTKCKVVHASNPTTSVTKLESSQDEFESVCSNTSWADSTFQMVVTGSEHFEGSMCTTKCFPDYNHHRCKQFGLGWTYEQPYRARKLVIDGENGTYQLFGNESGFSNIETFSSTFEEPECDDQIRFDNGLSIPESTRWDKISEVMPINLGALEPCHSEQDHSESSPHFGEGQCFGRYAEQTENCANGMGSEQNSGLSIVQSLGESIDRSFCDNRKQANSIVLFMDKSSSSICDRCTLNKLEQDVCLCVSSNSIDRESSGTLTEPGSMHNHSDCSILAETVLVPSVVESVDSTPCQTTVQSESAISSKRQDSPSRSKNVESDCMVGIDRRLSSKGFSKQTRKLLKSSWRQGTQRDYKCKFRQFSDWCQKQEIDPYAASLSDCANFLTFLFFDKKLAYKTINGYRSMLSAVLPPIGKTPIGQHPFIIRLLKGIFNERPPVKKLVPEWDLSLVLGWLQKPPFEPMREASLKYTTWKTCFLVAITTFQRCSDIQALQLGETNVNVQKKGVTFLRTGLSKTDRPGHMKTSIFVPAFTHNKLLDPKRALSYYLKKTEVSRKEGSNEKLKLFLAINKPHNPVSKQTISKWLVKTIQGAYQKENKRVPKVRGHSTRSVGPSWALFKGASLVQIMESADWTTESTFVKHYLKPVNMDFLKI